MLSVLVDEPPNQFRTVFGCLAGRVDRNPLTARAGNVAPRVATGSHDRQTCAFRLVNRLANLLVHVVTIQQSWSRRTGCQSRIAAAPNMAECGSHTCPVPVCPSSPGSPRVSTVVESSSRSKAVRPRSCAAIGTDSFRQPGPHVPVDDAQRKAIMDL